MRQLFSIDGFRIDETLDFPGFIIRIKGAGYTDVFHLKNEASIDYSRVNRMYVSVILAAATPIPGTSH